MAFWSDPKIEPKRQFRAVLQLGDGKGGLSDAFALKSFSKPGWGTIEIDQKYVLKNTGDVEILNIKKGGRNPKPLQLSFYDLENYNNISNAFMKYLAAGGTNIKQAEHYQNSNMQVTSRFQVEQTNVFYIMEINSDAQEIGKWKIWNPKLTAIDFGEIDYSSEEFSLVNTTWTYSDFTYELLSTQVFTQGQNVFNLWNN